jgi:hypothetical protein
MPILANWNIGIIESIIYAHDVEVNPVKFNSSYCRVVDSDLEASMFSVYVRYGDKYIDEGLPPSQCIADFSTREAADSFAYIISILLKNKSSNI